MSSVDERVVEMRFDNAQFEHGVQQTISSLDRLKQGLKFDNVLNGANSLQNVFNGIKLKKISDNVAGLNKRFSAAGVAGMEVVKRVTNSALNAAKQITSVVPNQIKNGGWTRAMNLANAKFQLEGLGESWKNVGKDVSFAVNQTSYGLDEAAKVAGQLAASGVKASDKIKLTNDNVDDFAKKMDGVTDRMHAAQNALKSNDLDQMSIALRGISGVASMTGASFSEIGQIFTRVAGQGRVYATDLNSIAVRGLNATAILAKQLGKSEADIRDMTKKGEIDFNTFSNAMYNAFANQATKANDTFTGSLANMKSALSRIGADVADDVLPAGTKVFNSLRLMFNQVHKTVQPVLDSLGKLVVASGNTISGVIDKITGKMSKGGKAFTTPVQVISKAIDGLTAGVEALGEKAGVKKTISDVKALADAMKAVNEKYNTLKNMGQGFKNIGKVIGNALDAVKESFLWTFRDWGTDLSKINIKSLSKQFADFTGKFANSTFRMERLRQIIGNIVNGILEFAKPIVTTIKTLGQAIDETFNDIWGNGSGFASLTKTFRDFSRSMDLTKDGAEGLKDVFKAILSPLRVIVPLASAATKVILNFLAAINRVAGKGLDSLGKTGAIKKAGDAITQFGQKIKDAFNKLKEWGTKNDVFNKFAAGCATAFVKVVDVVAKFVETLAKAGTAVAEWGSKHQVFQKFGTAVAEGFTKARDAVTKFFGAIKDSGVLSGIGNFFKTIGSTVVDFFSKLSKTEGFSKLVDGIGKLKDAIGTRLGDVFSKITDGLGTLGGVKVDASGLDKVVGFFDKLSGFVGTGLGKFGDFLKEESPIKRLIDWIKELGQDIADSKFADIITKIPDFFKNLFDAIKDGLQNFTFKGAFDSIKDFFKNGFSVDVYGAELNDDSDVEKIKGATQRKSSGIISAIKGMASNIKNAVGSIDWSSIGKSIQNGVGKVIDGINNVFANPAVKLLADNIRSFLTAILAIRALKKVGDMFDSFAGVGDSIAGFFKTLSGKIAGNLPKKSKLKDFTECVAILAGTLAGLSILNHYIGIDPAAIATLAGIIGSLVAVFKIVGSLKTDTKGVQSFNGMCRSLAVAVGTLALVTSSLSKMDWGDFGNGFGKLAIMLATLGTVVGLINHFSTTPIKGGAFVGLAAALTMLLIPLNILKGMTWDDYLPAIEKLGILMAALAGAVGLMNRISGGNSVGFGTMIGFAASLLAAVKALESIMDALNGMDEDPDKYKKLAAAATAIAGVFVAWGLALALAGTSENKHGLGEALSLIGGVLAISMALNSLTGTIKSDGYGPLLVAATAMGMVFVAWGGAIALAGKNKNSTGTALAMVANIAALFIALQTLTETASTANGFKGLIAAAASMSGVFLALGTSIRIASKQKIDTSNILAMIVAISGIGLALNGLAKYDFSSLAGSAIAMGGALLALGGALKMMNNVKVNPSAIAAMAVSIGMLAPALAALSNIKFSALVGAGGGLAVGLMGLAAGIAAIGQAGKVAAGSLGGLMSVAAGITAFGASITAAAAAITAGASMLTNAVGSIVGIFSKGIGNKIKSAADEMNNGIVDSFKSLGKGLKDFGKGGGQGIESFIGGIVDAFTNGGEKVKGAKDKFDSDLTGQNGELVTTNILGDYTAVGNDIDTGTGVITKSLDAGGEKVKGSSDKFQTSLLGAFDPSKFLKGKGKIDVSSIVDNFLPDSSLSGVEEKAKGKLDKVFGNINIGDLQNALQSSITKGGGFDAGKLLDNIPGIDNVGSDLKEKLQTGLQSAFSSGSFDPSQMLDLTKMFGDVSSKAEDSGKQAGQSYGTGLQEGVQEGQEGLTTGMSQNLSSLIEQNNQLRDAGTQGGQQYASGLQEGMQNVSGAVTTIGSSVVSGLMEYGSQLEGEGRNSGMQYVNGLQEGMSNINGVVTLTGSNIVAALLNYGSQISNQGRITGTQFVDAFKEGLSGLNGAVTLAGSTIISSLLSYASQLSSQGQNMGMQFAQGLQDGMSQAAASVASTVSHIVSIVSGMGGSFTAAGSACGMLFRAGLNSGMSGIGATVAAAVSNAAKALSELGGKFSTAGKTAGTQFVSGLRTGASQAGAAGRQLVTNATASLSTSTKRFHDAGLKGAGQYCSGLNAGAKNATTAGAKLTSNAISGMNKGTDGGKGAGQKTGQSFVSGLSASSGPARTAGQTVGKAGASGLNVGTAAAYQYGAHLGENFAKGIASAYKLVAQASAQLAAAAKANIGHSVPKEGPLKGGEVPYGLHAGQNFAEGLKKATPNVSTASMKMAQTVQNAMTNSIAKSLSTTKKGTDDLINLLNSGTDRVTKSTVNITKMVNDQWAKTHKTTKKSKSSSSDSSSDTDPNESFVSGLSSDIQKAKERNQLSLADEIKGYKLAMAKVKASANATADAQKNANDAVYDAAEKYIEKRQKQFGDYSTDESIFWKAITETVDKGSEAYTKSVDKMNDAIISDTEHLLTVRKRQVGEYETQAATIWEISKQGAKRLGASDKTMTDITNYQSDALISDGEHMIALRKKYLGEYEGNAAEVWKNQMEYGKKLKVNQEAQERAMFNYSDGIISDTEDTINKQKQVFGDALENTAQYWQKCIDKLEEAEKRGEATAAAVKTAEQQYAESVTADVKNRETTMKQYYGDKSPFDPNEWIAASVENSGNKEHFTDISNYYTSFTDKETRALNRLKKAQGSANVNEAEFWENARKNLRNYGQEYTATTDDFQDKAENGLKTFVKNQIDKAEKAANNKYLNGGALYDKAIKYATQHKMSEDTILDLQESRDSRYQTDLKNRLTAHQDWLDEMSKNSYDEQTNTLAGWAKVRDEINASPYATPDIRQSAQEKVDSAAYSDVENAIARNQRLTGKYVTQSSKFWRQGRKDAERQGVSLETLAKIDQATSKAITTDAKNAAEAYQKAHGQYVPISNFYLNALEEMSKDIEQGKGDMEEFQSLADTTSKQIVTDAKNAATAIQKKFGKNSPTYGVLKPWETELKNLVKQGKASMEDLESLSDTVGEAFETDNNNLLSTYRRWRDITPENFYEDEKVENVKFWESIVKSTKEGSAEHLKAMENYLSSANSLMDSYNSNVQSSAKSIMSAFNLLSETSFSDSVSEDDILRRAENADAAASRYAEAVDRIQQAGTFSQDFQDYLFSQIGVKDFQTLETISNMTVENQKKLQDAFDNTKDHAITASKLMWQHLIVGLDPALKENADTLKTSLSNLFQVVGNAMFDDNNLKILTAGISTLINQTMSDKMVESEIAKIRGVGNNMSIGLANGIIDGDSVVSNAMSSVVSNAIASAKTAADSHSPSKKTIKLGQYMGEGLVIGLKNWMSQAGVAGDQLTNGALGGLSSRIADIVDAMGQDMDMSPVITPVLDLSQVASGFADYDAMLTTAKAQELSARMRASYASAQDAQNGVNNQPISNTSIGRINITINPTANQDANDIADSVLNKINERIIRKGKVYSA